VERIDDGIEGIPFSQQNADQWDSSKQNYDRWLAIHNSILGLVEQCSVRRCYKYDAHHVLAAAIEGHSLYLIAA